MSEYSHSDHSKKMKKSKKKKNAEPEDPPDTESSEEELDLTKDCHPIAFYMNDRAEMISQMFSVIKGNKLRSMLPPILKDYDVEKIKLQCLDQLLGMSEKRINCILEGEILETSSESEVASDAESKDSSDSSQSEKSEKASKNSSSKKKGKRKSDTESLERASKFSKTGNEAQPVEQGKTLLEILELEMRARAIRALLKQGGEPELAAAEEAGTTGDVVDLTADEEFPTVIKTEPPSTEQELNFDNKVVKSVEADKNKGAEVKKKKLMAELELRNKLIKKKSYRTQQQRIENLGEEKIDQQEEKEGREKEKETALGILPEIQIKEEPQEIVIEDAEEGEVSSDDEVAAVVVVKAEKEKSPEPVPTVEKPMDGERILAIDNGQFVPNNNLTLEKEALEVMEVEKHSREIIELIEDEDISADEPNLVEKNQISQDCSADGKKEGDDNSADSKKESNENSADGEPEPSSVDDIPKEESTWRSRWLSNDEVQKVVKSSKICGLVKKRIAKKKINKMEEKVLPESEPMVAITPTEVVEGTVREYETLVGKVQEENDSTNDKTEAEIASDCVSDENSSQNAEDKLHAVVITQESIG